MNGEKDDGKGKNGEVDLLLEERNRVRDELRKAQGKGDKEAIKKSQERLTAINSAIRERAMMREGSADKSQFSTVRGVNPNLREEIVRALDKDADGHYMAKASSVIVFSDDTPRVLQMLGANS